MKRDKTGRIEIALTVQDSGQKRPVSNSAFHLRLILGLVVSLKSVGWADTEPIFLKAQDSLRLFVSALSI